MPITREQFEKGLNNQQTRVVNFLELSPDQAFTIDEIIRGLGISLANKDVIAVSAILAGWNSLLDKLADDGLIEKKTVNEMNYYLARHNKYD